MKPDFLTRLTVFLCWGAIIGWFPLCLLAVVTALRH
jgi:hypothetical protein